MVLVVGVVVAVVVVVGVVVVGVVVGVVIGVVVIVVVVVSVVVGVVQMHSRLKRPLPVSPHPRMMQLTGDMQREPSNKPYPFLHAEQLPLPLSYSHRKSHDQQFRAHSHRAPVFVRLPEHSVLSSVLVWVDVGVLVPVVVVAVVVAVLVWVVVVGDVVAELVAVVVVVGVVVGVLVVGVVVAVDVPVVVGVVLNLNLRASPPEMQRVRCKKYSAAAIGFCLLSLLPSMSNSPSALRRVSSPGLAAALPDEMTCTTMFRSASIAWAK